MPPRKRDEEAKLLLSLAAQWQRQGVHLFDQGYASRLWLKLLIGLKLRFIVRWRKHYHLIDAHGSKRPTWHLTGGNRGRHEPRPGG